MIVDYVDKILMKKDVDCVQIPSVKWEDIGGLESVKSELINSIQLPLKFPHLFSAGIKRSGSQRLHYMRV